MPKPANYFAEAAFLAAVFAGAFLAAGFLASAGSAFLETSFPLRKADHRNPLAAGLSDCAFFTASSATLFTIHVKLS